MIDALIYQYIYPGPCARRNPHTMGSRVGTRQERCIQIVTKFAATQVARAIVDTTLSNDTTLSKDGQSRWVKWATDVFQTTMQERLTADCGTPRVATALHVRLKCVPNNNVGAVDS